MILASSSPRRVELMERFGYRFRAVPADVCEARLPHESPLELVTRLARAKALAVVGSAAPDEVVVGADTVVWVGDTALGKPSSPAEAAAMLRRLSGRTHHVSTGCCTALRTGRGQVLDEVFTTTTDVRFYELADAEIDAYVACGESSDKAGAYAIQGVGGRFVESVCGSYDNVVGLPVAELHRHLKAFLRSL